MNTEVKNNPYNRFAASRSNTIYKDGGTVKQSGIAARLIIKYK